MAQNQAVHAAVRSPDVAADAALAVIELVGAKPQRQWRTSELVRALDGHSVLEVVLAVATLHRNGELERTAVATYRQPSADPGRVAARNATMLWGEDA